MASVTLSARGSADPATVWARYDQLALWSTWAPQIQRVTSSDDRLAPGLTGVVHAGPLSRPTVPVSFEVLTVDEERRTWSWRAQLGPVSMHLDHGVVADADGRSRAWLDVRAPLPVVLSYAPIARLALGRLVSA